MAACNPQTSSFIVVNIASVRNLATMCLAGGIKNVAF